MKRESIFEAKIEKASVFKKIVESIKEIVIDAKFDCTVFGICLNAMDAAKVSLVYLNMEASGFEYYKCERNISFSVNMDSLLKVMKCSSKDDSVIIRSNGDNTLNFRFDSESVFLTRFLTICR